MGLDNDDIKQLIAILQKGLVDDDHDSGKIQKRKPKPTRKSSQNNTKTCKKSKNLFEQMPERSLHKDDVAIDRKLRKFPPTQRSRDFKELKVRCRVCGREEKINPVLVESTDRYKCNKCSTSAG